MAHRSTRATVKAGHRSRRFGAPRPGTAPGTLSIDPNARKPIVRLVAFGPDQLHEETLSDLSALESLTGRWPVVWLNVDGLGDADTLLRIGDAFGLHRLTLEDIVNVPQRPKMEAYEGYMFIVARMLTRPGRIDVEQLSMVLGPGHLLTFQEHHGDIFEPVRGRLREGGGRLRHAGSGYLAYALLDAVVDHYFPVFEQLGEDLEELEHEALNWPTKRTIERIHDIKRELLQVRRSIWPLRDMLNGLVRTESQLFQPEDRLHLQDCYDHAVRVMDLVESYREIGSGLMDVYLSSISNRMNEIMKVLTLFASIFIPLSFVAGLYGMNFDTASPWNMPELGWRWGYLFALGLMALVAGGLLSYFWRQGWIGRRTAKNKRNP